MNNIIQFAIMSTHLVPLQIPDGNSHRNATDAEVQAFLGKASATATKWNTANRIAYAKRQMAMGVEHKHAWAEAFNLYPDTSNKGKPRFVFNP